MRTAEDDSADATTQDGEVVAVTQPGTNGELEIDLNMPYFSYADAASFTNNDCSHLKLDGQMLCSVRGPKKMTPANGSKICLRS